MLTIVGNREVVSDTGFSIKIEGMYKLLYSFNGLNYVVHVEPLVNDPNGYNMMIESSSISLVSDSKTVGMVSEDERDRILRDLLEGVPALGVSPWVHK